MWSVSIWVGLWFCWTFSFWLLLIVLFICFFCFVYVVVLLWLLFWFGLLFVPFVCCFVCYLGIRGAWIYCGLLLLFAVFKLLRCVTLCVDWLCCDVAGLICCCCAMVVCWFVWWLLVTVGLVWFRLFGCVDLLLDVMVWFLTVVFVFRVYIALFAFGNGLCD